MWGISARRHGLALLTTGLFVVSGLLLGFVAYGGAVRYQERKAIARLDQVLHRQAAAIEHTVGGYFEVLISLRSLFDCSQVVIREEFARFTRGARQRHPTIQAFEWAPRVSPDTRGDHTRRARLDGLEGYAVRELGADGRMVPASPGDVYYPVLFMEPLAGNEKALGYDLASEERRRRAIIQALQTGEATFTEPIGLVQDEARASAVLAFLPVYEQPAVPVIEEGPGLAGFVLLVLRVCDILEAAQLLIPAEEWAPVDVELKYIDSNGDEHPVAGRAPADDPAPPPARDGSRSRRLDLGGQQWALVGRPTTSLLGRSAKRQPWLVAMGTTALWGILGGLFFFLLRRTRHQIQRRQDRLVRRVLGSLSEGVIVVDAKGQLVLANDSAERLVGVPSTLGSPTTGPAGRPWTLAEDPRLFPHDEHPVGRALRGESVVDAEVVMHDAHSSRDVWLSVTGASLRDTHGGLEGGVAVLRNVTRRKESDAVIRRLYKAVQYTDDTVFITGSDGTIEFVNPAFERMTEYSKEEALGKTPALLKSGLHDPSYYTQLWSKILAGQVHRSSVINRKKSGELWYGDQTITPTLDADGQVSHFVSVVKDMTEQRKIHEHEAELRVASAIQERLYPKQPPDAPGYDIAGSVFSASATCGDYLDFIQVQEGLLTIAVGDVCGHGIGPALLMAETRAYLRSLCGVYSEPDRILDRLDHILSEDLDDSRFVTLLVANLDTEHGHITCASGGHPPAFILDASGALKHEIGATGTPLGLYPELPFKCHAPQSLARGDIVVLYTDGITESRAPDGECFGEERMLEVVRSHRGEPASRIVEELYRAACAFTHGAPQLDDITLAVCRRED